MANLAARVYVWLPNANGVGHAAMHIGAGAAANDSTHYVSWWPKEGAGRTDVLPGVMKTSETATFSEDLGNEGGTPNYTFNLYDLDVTAMKVKWDETTKKKDSHWRAGHKNCSTIVARVLRAGGAADLARIGVLPSWDAHRVFWTPKMVATLCDGIVRNGHGNVTEYHRPVVSSIPYQILRMV